VATRGLYKAADGSWKLAQARASRLLYTLTGRALGSTDDDRVLVVHPDRASKVVYPDGRVEEIAAPSR
jgi:hypothetical protein